MEDVDVTSDSDGGGSSSSSSSEFDGHHGGGKQRQKRQNRYKKYRYVVYEQLMDSSKMFSTDGDEGVAAKASRFLVAHVQPDELRQRVWQSLFGDSTVIGMPSDQVFKPKFWEMLFRFCFVRLRVDRTEKTVEFLTNSTTTSGLVKKKMPLFVEFGSYLHVHTGVNPENWFALFMLQFLRTRNLSAILGSYEWRRRLALRSDQHHAFLLQCLEKVHYTSDAELARELTLLQRNMRVTLRPLPPLSPTIT
jgi:hypothetical protein